DKGQWNKSGANLYYDGGYVGIGTSNPVRELEVKNFRGSFDATGGGAAVYRADDLGKGGNFNFNTSRGTPEVPLILQAGDQGGYMTFRAYDGDEYGAIAGIQAVVKSGIANDSTPGELVFMTTPLGSKSLLRRMVINESGNVGIGANAPSERLEVEGNVRADAYLYTSDQRLKENVETLSNSCEKVLALRGVEFDWKKSGKHEIGFIAQEVEVIEPNLVITSEVDGIKAVKYANIVALLVEAFKDHHKKLEENQKMFMVMSKGLNDRVKSLEREVASLRE